MKLAGLLSEAIAGSASSSFRNPGHMAKLNQAQEVERAMDSDEDEEGFVQENVVDWLETGKLYKIDLHEARNELAALAYELAANIQEMHIPDASDRKTEKMTKQRLVRMFELLKKLQRLAN